MIFEAPTIKRGQSFSAAWQLSAIIGGAAVTDMTGWTGVSQARRRTGELVEDLAFSWVDAAASVCRVTAASTTLWPVDLIDIDIMLTAPSGDRVATPTVSIRVVQGPTHV